jgi:2-oxo-3-(phosphooxy)propyl 3-oxoalkanoate synthase
MSVTLEELSFDRNIPRGIVHRESIAEVFLTDARPTADGATFAAQLPRNHSYFSDHRGTAATYDPLLLVEVFRQVAIYYAHAFLGVDRSEKFIFAAADFEILDQDTLRIGSCPGHCVIEARVVQQKTREGAVIGQVLEMVATIEDRVAAREEMTYQWMPGEVWRRVRRRGRESLGLAPEHRIPAIHHVARMRPGSVGRHNPRNAILANPELDGGGRLRALTIIDTDHPSLFDHALDHVPGMLQFEAARQVAMAAANATLGLDTSRMVMHRMRIEFTKFGEFERDTIAASAVRPDEDGNGALADVDLRQGEDPIATGWVHLKLLPVDVWTMVQ